MKFFDLHVHTNFSGGESSILDLAKTAKLLGYHGICLVFYANDVWNVDVQTEMEKVRKEVGIELYIGLEARNIREVKELSKKRKSFDIMLVKGGDLNLNRIACQTPEVDVLSLENNLWLDHVGLKLAAKNDVAIEINFREILNSSRATRSKLLSNIEKNFRICMKYSTPIIICSGAMSCWELRSPECLASFATLFNVDLKTAKELISKVPERIVKKAFERRNDKWIMPGVRIVG